MVAAKNALQQRPLLFETALRWSPIALSEVLDSKYLRLEASRFSLEARHARQLVESRSAAKLAGEGGLLRAFHFPQFKRVFVKASPFPIFQPGQINDIRPKARVYLSDRTKVDMDALRVKEGQVLLTCSGTIGDTTYVSKTLANSIFSHDLIRLEAEDPSVARYVYAYLRTRTGRVIVAGEEYGVIKHIEPEHLESVPVPIGAPAIRERISSLIDESFRLRDESNSYWERAEQRLFTTLQLPPISELEERTAYQSRDPKCFATKASKLAGRLEASYHDPVLDQILGSYADWESLSSLTDAILLAGRFKRIYVDSSHGTVFIGGKQLTQLDPNNKKYLSLSHHSQRIIEQLRISENMVLVSCSGTIGKVCLAPKHWEGWAASQHVLRVVVGDSARAAFIACWLSTEYGQALVMRNKYGAVVDEINEEHLGSVLVPRVDPSTMKEIGDDVLRANALRYRAHLLEQSAISIFDREVLGLSE